jgi:hypothetical protein
LSEVLVCFEEELTKDVVHDAPLDPNRERP